MSTFAEAAQAFYPFDVVSLKRWDILRADGLIDQLFNAEKHRTAMETTSFLLALRNLLPTRTLESDAALQAVHVWFHTEMFARRPHTAEQADAQTALPIVRNSLRAAIRIAVLAEPITQGNKR